MQDLPYAEAYADRTTHAPHLPFGPVDLAAPEAHDLLVSAFASRGAQIPPWRLLIGRQGIGRLYAVGLSIRRMQRRGRRLLAQRRWAAASRSLSELPWAMPALTTPPDLSPEARRWIAGRVRRWLGADCPWRRAWIDATLRIVRGPSPTHARTLVNAPRTARSIRIAATRSAPEALRSLALAGWGMRQFKVYLKLPRRRSQEQISSELTGHLEEWLCRLRVAIGCAMRGPSPAQLAHQFCTAAPGTAPAARTEAEQVHAASMPIPSAELAIVPEDKDGAAAWTMPATVYAICSLHFLEQDGVWRASRLSRAQAAAETAALFSDAVSQGMARPPSKKRWEQGLPAMYLTVRPNVGATGDASACVPCTRACGAYHRGFSFPSGAS